MARATRPSRWPSSRARWTLAPASSTPPMSTARTPTRPWSARRSAVAAARPSWRPSSDSCARATAPSAASTAAPITCAPAVMPASRAWASMRSTCITCTASIPACRSRKPSARWRTWSVPARRGTWACRRLLPRPCAAPAWCTRSAPCRASTRCGRAIPKPPARWPRAASWAWASWPTARWGAASSPALSARRKTSPRTTTAAAIHASRPRTSPATWRLPTTCANWPGARL